MRGSYVLVNSSRDDTMARVLVASVVVSYAMALRMMAAPPTFRKKPALAPPTRKLESLRVGDKISDGVPLSRVFEGKSGAKMWLDVGAWHEVTKNGTPEKRRIRGMLRLPRNFSAMTSESEAAADDVGRSKPKKQIEESPQWRKVAKMLAAAYRDPFKKKVTCYVEASRPDSSRLVLSAKPPKAKLDRAALDRCLDLEALEVGTPLRGAYILSVGKTLCRLRVPVARCGRRKKNNNVEEGEKMMRTRRVDAFLRQGDLPENVVLGSQIIKPEGARVLRKGDSIDYVYAKRIRPGNLGLDVSLEPCDAESIAADDKKRREARLERGRRRSRTNELKVGTVVRGKVVKIFLFGAIVDFGASATGVVLRNKTPLVDLKHWKDEDDADYRVVAVERTNRPAASPRVTLERILPERDGLIISKRSVGDDVVVGSFDDFPSSATTTDSTTTSFLAQEEEEEEESEEDDDDEYDDADDLDDIDAIEEALGLDTY